MFFLSETQTGVPAPIHKNRNSNTTHGGPDKGPSALRVASHGAHSSTCEAFSHEEEKIETTLCDMSIVGDRGLLQVSECL